jgi:phytoene synthase
LADLKEYGVELESLLLRKKRLAPNANEQALLKGIGRRAEGYYKSGQELMPLIDKESRPALWVLVSIYHALLKRIEKADFDVFSQRASVPLWEKLFILVVGLTRMMWVRVVG